MNYQCNQYDNFMSMPFRPSDQCHQPPISGMSRDLYVTPVHDNHKTVYLNSYSREEEMFLPVSGNTS